MPPKGRPHAAPKRRVKGKTKASAVPLRRSARVVLLNRRKLLRRSALKTIAQISRNVDGPLLSSRSGSAKQVDAAIRFIETHCGTPEVSHARNALRQWEGNGGQLETPLADDTMGSDAELAPCVIGRHKILERNFRLESKAFMCTYNSRTFDRSTWTAFQTWVRCVSKRYRARAWAACLELSVHASPHVTTATSASSTPNVFHLHAYWYWNDGVGIRHRNTDSFVFADVRPRVDKCLGTNGNVLKWGAYHGLWYVTVIKLGTEQSDTNFKPWSNYVPQAAWLRELWNWHKLTHKQFLGLSAQFRTGHSSRKKEVEEVRRDEKQISLEKHINKELQGLAKAAIRSFPEVQRFVDVFRGAPRWRRAILAIIGVTNAGKSMLGAEVLKLVGEVLGIPGFLEVTVEGDDNLDMSDFDLEQHAGVLFDGVGDALALKRNREVLQGRPKIVKGGRSPTMTFAYPYTLCRRAVVATFDLSAASLDLFATDHWLSDSRNVLVLRLNEQAWVSSAPLPTPVVSQPHKFHAWTVARVVQYLEGEDLAGPARVIHANAVNGTDFLNLTFAVLTDELRMSPFAARKVLSARDAAVAFGH